MFGLQQESTPWRQISAYMVRAQAMLTGREPQQVNYGGLLVGWLLGEVVPPLGRESQEDRGEATSGEGPFSVNGLVHFRHRVPIDGIPDFPGASWPELLASYAIHCLGQAHVAFQLKRDRLEEADSEPDEEDHAFALTMDRKFLGDLLEAVDAVGYAERLWEAHQDAATEAKLLFTQQQRDKSLKRHQATNAAKEEFFLFWAQGDFKNRSEAARSFLRMLDREHRNPFTGRQDSTVRTLIRALRVWLREEQSTDYEGPEYE